MPHNSRPSKSRKCCGSGKSKTALSKTGSGHSCFGPTTPPVSDKCDNDTSSKVLVSSVRLQELNQQLQSLAASGTHQAATRCPSPQPQRCSRACSKVVSSSCCTNNNNSCPGTNSNNDGCSNKKCAVCGQIPTGQQGSSPCCRNYGPGYAPPSWRPVWDSSTNLRPCKRVVTNTCPKGCRNSCCTSTNQQTSGPDGCNKCLRDAAVSQTISSTCQTTMEPSASVQQDRRNNNPFQALQTISDDDWKDCFGTTQKCQTGRARPNTRELIRAQHLLSNAQQILLDAANQLAECEKGNQCSPEQLFESGTADRSDILKRAICCLVNSISTMRSRGQGRDTVSCGPAPTTQATYGTTTTGNKAYEGTPNGTQSTAMISSSYREDALAQASFFGQGPCPTTGVGQIPGAGIGKIVGTGGDSEFGAQCNNSDFCTSTANASVGAMEEECTGGYRQQQPEKGRLFPGPSAVESGEQCSGVAVYKSFGQNTQMSPQMTTKGIQAPSQSTQEVMAVGNRAWLADDGAGGGGISVRDFQTTAGRELQLSGRSNQCNNNNVPNNNGSPKGNNCEGQSRTRFGPQQQQPPQQYAVVPNTVTHYLHSEAVQQQVRYQQKQQQQQHFERWMWNNKENPVPSNYKPLRSPQCSTTKLIQQALPPPCLSGNIGPNQPFNQRPQGGWEQPVPGTEAPLKSILNNNYYLNTGGRCNNVPTPRFNNNSPNCSRSRVPFPNNSQSNNNNCGCGGTTSPAPRNNKNSPCSPRNPPAAEVPFRSVPSNCELTGRGRGGSCTPLNNNNTNVRRNNLRLRTGSCGQPPKAALTSINLGFDNSSGPGNNNGTCTAGPNPSICYDVPLNCDQIQNQNPCRSGCGGGGAPLLARPYDPSFGKGPPTCAPYSRNDRNSSCDQCCSAPKKPHDCWNR